MNSSRLRRAAAPLAVLLLSAVVAAAQGPGFVPPVDSPISDEFRPPATPFSAGNRGVDYDTDPGDPVRASGDGEVVFAGHVAGSLHVTVLHEGDIRTSYSFLHTVDVVEGERVTQGQPIATAGDSLHFGARRGDEYFDPTTLFDAAGLAEVELLPFEVPPSSRPEAEQAALIQLAFDLHGDGLSLPGLDGVASMVLGQLMPSEYSSAIDPRNVFATVWELGTRLSDPPPCSDEPPPPRPVAAQDRQALLVGGLGSSVTSASINDLRTAELGYADEAVARLDYDSEGDLLAAAYTLADRVEALAAEHPDSTLDLYGHSMGGVVVRLGLFELQRRHFDLSRLGLVATFGSPHQGTGLATMAVKGKLWSDAPAVGSLREGSRIIADLAQTELPEGVHFLSLGASGDIVVPAPKTVVPGATNLTVGMTGLEAHGDLVESDEATAEVSRALAGHLPSCESPPEVVEELVMGEGIAYVEDVLGFAVLGRGG